MKILMLSTQNAGIAWWRFQAPAKALRAAGHAVTVFEEPEYAEAAAHYGDLWGWLQEHAKDYDVIHAGYSSAQVFTQILLALRHKDGKRILTDIDDDYKAIPAYNLGFKTFGPATLDRRIVRAQLLVSDAVSVSTSTLEGALDTGRIRYLLPNMYYPPDWAYPRDPARDQDKAVRIMLAGGYGRFGDWELVREALLALAAKYQQRIKILFFGCTPDWVEPLMADKHNPGANTAFYIQPALDPAQFPRLMRRLAPDIYLSPTITNPFNASKSDIKAVEAALAGAAFMCTDFTTYRDVPSEACLKVSNTYAQWFEGLSALVEDPALRARLTGKCQEWAAAQRDITKHVGIWEAVYEKVLAQAPIQSLADLTGVATIH